MGEKENLGIKRNVYLIGPHSTGKSFLCAALNQYYQSKIPILQETARKVLQQKGYTKNDIESKNCVKMQEDIMHAQLEAENYLLGKGQNFISDRSAIDPIIYCYKYSPFQDEWKKLLVSEDWSILVERYRNSKKSLIILLEPCNDFLQDDGIRKLPKSLNEWSEFSSYYEDIMKVEKIPYVKIEKTCKDIDERVLRVVNLLDQ